jgi:hypothetical protein
MPKPAAREKFCKLTNDQVVWIEFDKATAVGKFLTDEDHAQSYLVKYDGKKRFRDSESLGDATKKYDLRLKKFIEVPPYMHVYLRKDKTIDHISEDPDYNVEHGLKYMQLATMTAAYYFENGLPLSKDVERYVTN